MKRPPIDDGQIPQDEPPLFALARHSDPATSKQAAASLDGEALSHLHQVVLDHLAKVGEHGATTVEIADAADVERDSISPRMTWLVKHGHVADSGRTRVPAGRTRSGTVWVLAKHQAQP